MSNHIVQSLWIGERLSVMEQLGIRSFLANGHEFHLYSYNAVENTPAGATLKDAREILPADRVFAYSSGFGQGSYSAFSNFFRYKLLLDRGGWWVDTDVVCLRPFDFPGEHVLASEQAPPATGGVIASPSAMKQPPGSALMEWAWDICQRRDPASLRWGEIGPLLVQAGIDTIGWQHYMQPPTVFSPVPFYDWRGLIDPLRTFTFGEEVHAVHLWHQMWREHRVDPDGEFPDACLYEQLKRRFLNTAGGGSG